MHRHAKLSALMAAAMGASTFPLLITAVLAADLIAEFEVPRWQIGLLATASSLSGAFLAPRLGGLVDRFGAKRSVIATLIVSGTSMIAMAVSPIYLLLFGAALASGLSQAISNPATNKLIALHVEPGSRGVVTGIKQSGVQFGAFLGGISLPLIADRVGWRWAVATFGIGSLITVILARAGIASDGPQLEAANRSVKDPLPPFVWRLSVYGFLLGAGGAAIFQWLPLFAEEDLGLTSRAAGGAAALVGLIGIVGRIGWGRLSERTIGIQRALFIIALASVAATVCLWLAPSAGAWLIWPAAVITGATVSSWNSVGMLGVIQAVPSAAAGRASGAVLFGFLLGLGGAAPIFGLIVDRTGNYQTGWIIAFGMFLAGAAVMRPHATSLSTR